MALGTMEVDALGADASVIISGFRGDVATYAGGVIQSSEKIDREPGLDEEDDDEDDDGIDDKEDDLVTMVEKYG